MPSGIKIAKFIGGVIEVGFLISFFYEIGKEAGRKEQEEIAQQVQDSSSVINMKDFISILKNVDKNAVDMARMVK